MVRYIVHPKDKAQATAVKAIFKALKVPFEIETEPELNESPYNTEFVAKIKRSDKNFAEGKYTAIKIEDLWK